MDRILKFREVGFRYGTRWAVRDVDLEVKKGELVGILGANGSGKTTILKLANGVLEPERGEISLKGRSIKEYSRRDMAKEIAMVPQENHFHFSFSALEVVLMGRFPHLGRFEFEGKRDMEVAYGCLEATECLEFANRPIQSLSGGEKQRILIARALAQEPSLVLLDEPTSFLDLKFKKEIFVLISSLIKQGGLSALIVSHDIDLAAQYCHRLIMLKQGEVVFSGPPSEVVTSENIEYIFGCPVVVDVNPVTGTPRVNVA